MAKRSIAFIIAIVIILCFIAIKYTCVDEKASHADYISVIGSVISICGIVITLWQLYLVKQTTKEYNNQVKQEVANAQKKIKLGLMISTIENTIRFVSEATRYVQNNQFELALIRMEDGEILISEINTTYDFLLKDNKKSFMSNYMKYKESLFSIRKNLATPQQIAKNVVIDTLSKMKAALIDINSNIKKSLYE